MRWWITVAILSLVAIMPFLLAHEVAAQIPRDALKYRSLLTRNARMVWGLTAPVATFASQIHQESGFRADAVSRVGAQGLAQFMPGTSKWISGLYSGELGENQPLNPSWALRALVRYDKYLYDRVKGRTECDRFAKTLSAYNGGLGWVQRDERLAAQYGYDTLVWFKSVEMFNAGRSIANKGENREYPRRILLVIQPRYKSWGMGVPCP